MRTSASSGRCADRHRSHRKELRAGGIIEDSQERNLKEDSLAYPSVRQRRTRIALAAEFDGERKIEGGPLSRPPPRPGLEGYAGKTRGTNSPFGRQRKGSFGSSRLTAGSKGSEFGEIRLPFFRKGRNRLFRLGRMQQRPEAFSLFQDLLPDGIGIAGLHQSLHRLHR